MRSTHIVGPNGSLDQPAMEHGLKSYRDTLDRGLSSGGGRAHVMWDTHAGFLCMLPPICSIHDFNFKSMI